MKLSLNDININHIISSSYILIDTYSKEVWAYNDRTLGRLTEERILEGKNEYLILSTAETLSIIQLICGALVNWNPLGALTGNKGGRWIVWVQFFRIDEKRFLVMDDAWYPLYEISSLNLVFPGKKFIPSKNA